MQNLIDSVKDAVAQVQQLNVKMETVSAKIAETNLSVARLQVEVKHSSCAAPGSCVGLGANLEKMGERVGALEDVIQRIKHIEGLEDRIKHIEGLEDRIKPIEQRFQQMDGASWAMGKMFTVGTAAGGIVVWAVQTFLTKG